MKSITTTRLVLCVALAGTWLLSAQAHALAYVGTFLTDTNYYTLVHAGANPSATNGPDDWLRFAPDQLLSFDITNNMLTAIGPQHFNLQSNNGATATFTLLNLLLDLSGPNGMAGGFMDYELDGVGGTFTFLENLYGSSGFNTSSFDGTTFTGLIWGGDSVNMLGFDGAIAGNPVPLPGAIVLLGSALVAIGRRRKQSY